MVSWTLRQCNHPWLSRAIQFFLSNKISSSLYGRRVSNHTDPIPLHSMVEGFLIIQIQFLPCRHYFPALERKGSLFCFVSCVSLVLGLGLGILCVHQSRNLVYSCSESNRIRSCLVMEDYYSSNSTMTQNQFANNMAEMIASCTSVELQGVRSLTRIDCENTWKRSMSSSSYSRAMYLSDNEFGEQDRSDDCLHFGEKKRRMTFDQVKTLEKSFELRSNLDPDRKMQLAKALGLQPRQISVWFQNRRARWKTKQLEKDFDALKQEYDTLKRNYDILLQQNRQFKAEVQQRGRELEKKDGNSKVRGSEIEPQQNPDESVPATTDSPMELSLKSEIGTKCTEQLLHDNYPTATKEQEGACSSIITVAASSNCNINLRRTMEISESAGIPPVAAATAANRLFPVLAMEGLSGGEEVAANGLHEWHCQPKVEVDQISGEERQCNLFYSLEEQRALMLCEYWHDLPDE